jgi:hypothetical protein
MSDEKITHIEATPKGEAVVAVLQALRTSGDVRDRQGLALAIAAGIDAYQQALPKPAVEAVRLLRVQSGDIVVFHLADHPSLKELDDFTNSLQPLTAGHPGVKFIATELVADITVVRPESLADAVEEVRPDPEIRSRARERMQQLQDFDATIRGIFNSAEEIEARVCPVNWRDDTPCSAIDGGEHCCVVYRGHRENHACPCGATKDGGDNDRT